MVLLRAHYGQTRDLETSIALKSSYERLQSDLDHENILVKNGHYVTKEEKKLAVFQKAHADEKKKKETITNRRRYVFKSNRRKDLERAKKRVEDANNDVKAQTVRYGAELSRYNSYLEKKKRQNDIVQYLKKYCEAEVRGNTLVVT